MYLPKRKNLQMKMNMGWEMKTSNSKICIVINIFVEYYYFIIWNKQTKSDDREFYGFVEQTRIDKISFMIYCTLLVGGSVTASVTAVISTIPITKVGLQRGLN